MANYLSQRWLLNRRSLLRGLGVSVPLPLLDCMLPLRESRAASNDNLTAKRSAFIYIPNGVNVLTWQIEKAGRDYELSSTLKPLERHRERITPISGLHHPNGIGSRHNCDRVWLTGASAPQEAPTFRNTVSCDQLIAEVTSPNTRFGSLELSVGRGSTATLAYSREGVPLPAEDNPKSAFLRLFGSEPGGKAVSRRRYERRRSVLDFVMEDASATRRLIGTDDRIKLDDYLDSVRDVEKRVERLEQWLEIPRPAIDRETTTHLTRNVQKTDAGDYYRTMYDIIVLAFRTDVTRVATFMSGTEAVGLGIPEIYVPQTRHELSHHNGDPEQMRRLSQSDTFNVEQFSYFLDKLDQTKEQGRSLLDTSMILFGSGMSYGHVHANANLPIVFAGGQALGFKHGQHIDFNLPQIKSYNLKDAGSIYSLCGRPVDSDARLSNLLLTVMHKMGVRSEQFVDSQREFSEIL